MNPKNLYNIMGNYIPGQDWKDWVYENVYEKVYRQAHMKELTLHPPVASTHADKMILTLYGPDKLREVDALTINNAQLELLLYTQLLPKEPIRIDKMDVRGLMDKWEHIIPASAITQQYVDHKTNTITIPIEAFNNKSTLVFHRDNPETGQGMLYHYILIQSAKDPNIAHALAMFKGTVTDKLVTLITNQQLRDSKWDIKVEQHQHILQYMDHFTKAWPEIPAMARGPLKIAIPKGLYETATQGQSALNE